MQHVYVIVLTAFLCRNRWLRKRDRVPLELRRAQEFAKQGKVTIDGDPEDGPPPSGSPKRPTSPSDGDTPEKPRSKAPDPAKIATPLEEVGIAGKTADLLRAASIDTVEALRSATAVDDPVATLVALNGIGQKTAESILAALAEAE